MTRRETVVLVWVLCLVAILAFGMLSATLAPAREDARRIRCRNNLNQLAKGMATYLNEHGDNRSFPVLAGDYGGGEWLASLYWTGVIPDPGVFICPSTPDTNNDGRDLGSSRGASRIGAGTVSYAGLGSDSFPDGGQEPETSRDDFPPNKPMGCSDSEGTPNHPDGKYPLLFFDSHVEVPHSDWLIKTPAGYV
ncbi:DUF1559 domain-containing protein, partial [bacterium]|nr:DUF1559 domain-containing protein [bacterium]